MHQIIPAVIRFALAFCLVLPLSACGTSASAGSPASQTASARTEESASGTPNADPSSFLERLGPDPAELVNDLSEGVSDLTPVISAGSYEDIYSEYAKKLTDTGAVLLKEYQEEAAANTAGIEGLAEIANRKVEQLAEIDTEGTEAMAQFMFTKGGGSYEEYQKWATKLYEIYDSESRKIYDAYLSSVQ